MLLLCGDKDIGIRTQFANKIDEEGLKDRIMRKPKSLNVWRLFIGKYQTDKMQPYCMIKYCILIILFTVYQ